MSRNGKIVIGVLAGVLVLCLCVAVGGFVLFGAVTKTVVSNTATGPEEAAQVGHQIADYSLPTGWRELFSMHLLGFSMVGIQAGSPNQHVILMQMPANSEMSQEAMEAQLRREAGRRFPGLPTEMTVVDSQQVTVRGQQVTLSVSEGTNPQGQRYRSLFGVFQGENGPVMLAVAGTIDGWDETNFQSFLDSIR